ncbi:AMP-binding protein [Bacillus salitolerans]|uniref:AMP-binding protein n=1 Tax=Bacillus salitolerans TaxID=1437434 RepID=A0ABW4LNL6_9BACI
MSYFWEIGNKNGSFLLDETIERITYKELEDLVSEMQSLTKDTKKQLGIILCKNNITTLAAYLAGLKNNDASILLDAKLNQQLLSEIVDAYKPDWIMSTDEVSIENYKVVWERYDYRLYISLQMKNEIKLHPDIAVLLSTSGTTGSKKLVKLSYKNLQANAESIAEYLKLSNKEIPITSLPFQYSYGLSVINSHLLVGASIVMTDESVLSRYFWDLFNEQKVTSFAGVPYIYQMLHRLKFHKMDLPSLKSFTQAGGRLSENHIKYFYEEAIRRKCCFTVMYGQTEATARISYVPFHKLGEKVGSIGIPIPNGKLTLDEGTSEIVYSGPNVMMGYAETKEDLTIGDQLNGLLYTGDIGEMDEEGYFYIKGRIKRFIKLFGLRISLDELEKFLETKFNINVACVGNDENMKVIIEENNKEIANEIRQAIQEYYKLHPSGFKVVLIDEHPRLPNDKINYQLLKDL